MRDISGFMGTLYGSTEWIMRFSIINIVWFIINLPISIIIFSIFINGINDGFVVYLMPLVLLIPALFIPSTIAMFAIVRDWVMKKEQQSLMKVYLSYMKANYKKSFLSGLALMSIWLIWIGDFYFFHKENDVFTVIFLLIGIILSVYTINFFSFSVHYQMSSRTLMKNTFFLTIGSPLLSSFILLSNFLLLYLSATEFLFLFPFFTGSISAFLSFSAFYRFTLKMEKKVMANQSS